MRATVLNCSLKPSSEGSNTQQLADVVIDALKGHGVESEVFRLQKPPKRSSRRKPEPTHRGGQAMTESPQEMHDVPPEEDIDAADVGDRLDEDPEQVPNAPNRDPRDGEGSSVVPPEPRSEAGEGPTSQEQ